MAFRFSQAPTVTGFSEQNSARLFVNIASFEIVFRFCSGVQTKAKINQIGIP